MGHVEHIHIAPAEGAPVQSVSEIEAVAGAGLIGDRYATSAHGDDYDGGQDLTLVEAEALERLAAEDGIQLEPGATRRNVTTRGISLNDLVGKTFSVGGVMARGIELCEPCKTMEGRTAPGAIKALVHRAGLNAEILVGGKLRPGDEIASL